MASSSVLIPSPNSQGNPARLFTLLTAVVAVDDGDWIDAANWGPFSFQAEGITTAAVEICGSNNPTKPLNSNHGYMIGSSDLTADGMVEWQGRSRWIKMRVSSWTSGTINGWAIGAGQN